MSIVVTRVNGQSDLVSPKGKECETMNEYWGGSVLRDFDDDELTEKDKNQFLNLVADMIQWLPQPA
ncbi:hypothetical protein E4U30_001144 [Claviceps sp. LM220 group G6]|nr:hypothetical protein E4U30_001144 [Claviceps sp. LM220 group G6]KAG6104569.1 hypothetical protein E4U14_005648 [Claviceps sp. LM454 group G7]